MKKASKKAGIRKNESPEKDPNSGDRNSLRIQDQEERERAIRRGAGASTTPQGGGVGNSTQSEMEHPFSEDFNELNSRFAPIDPEMERSAGEMHESLPTGKKSTSSKSKKSRKEKKDNSDSKQKMKKSDPAHRAGEGDPSYASPNPQHRREWAE